jgi:hypothetical protein
MSFQISACFHAKMHCIVDDLWGYADEQRSSIGVYSTCPAPTLGVPLFNELGSSIIKFLFDIVCMNVR